MYRKLTRTALFLAVILLLQSLRFFIPVPPAFSTFFIGSLVNAALFLAVLLLGVSPAIFIAVSAPVVAYFQLLLPLPVFIIPVALGNITLIALFKTISPFGFYPGIVLAALGKTIALYASFTWLLTFIALPPQIASLLMSVMSWPQFITACLGGILAIAAEKRLKKIL